MQFGEVYLHGDAKKYWNDTRIKWAKELVEDQSFNIRGAQTKKIRETIRQKLVYDGWSDEIRISPDSSLTVFAKKDRTVVQVQTGNISRAAYDLIKLQFLYQSDQIDSAILIVPSKPMAKVLGSNIANFNRLRKELHVYGNVIALPLVLISFDE